MPYQPGDLLLEKYRLETLFGQGAFGDVYRVTHLGLRVPRALKVLRRDAPGIGSTEFTECQARFQLEAQLGAQLNSPSAHPNLLQIHNFEKSGDLLVLEMEYAPGGSLTEKLEKLKARGETLSIEAALQIALEVANGLAAMHVRDIVHRDLKPSNILFDDKGRAKVADLGLAQIPGGPSLRTQLSNPLPHPGTPGYMSPEQENTRSYLTPASDIYTLGVVLFEMLTGRVYRSLRPGTPASKFRADLPAALDELLARLLAKAVEERPWDGEETVEVLRGTLERFRAGDADQQAAREKQEGEAAEKARLLEEKRQQAEEAASQEAKRLAEAQTAEKAAREKQEHEAAEKAVREKMEQEARTKEAAEKTRLLEEQRRRELTLDLGEGATMEFVRIPAGEFWMGSDNNIDPEARFGEMPRHLVYLDEYLMGKYPVTNLQYRIFVQKIGYPSPSHWKDGNIPVGEENHPVIYVSWDVARFFCQWASQVTGQTVRLPSEAEWEKAARGADGRMYPWGDQKPDENLCNHYASRVSKATPVGKYSPQGDSPYGCADMAGNVWEWCADWFDLDYYKNSPVRHPTGPSSGQSRVMRGGSWSSLNYDARSAYRFWNDPAAVVGNLGFRCAMTSSQG